MSEEIMSWWQAHGDRLRGGILATHNNKRLLTNSSMHVKLDTPSVFIVVVRTRFLVQK
jgi:hypothetical protein